MRRWLTLLMLLAAPAAATSPAAWLQQHRQPIDPARPLALPAALRGGQVLLLGEVHGLRHGQQLDLALLKAAHAQAGVRRYIGEFDAAQAAAFNQALDTGATADLDAVFASWRRRGLQWANADFHRKLTAIIAWNRTLPAAQRIRFIGVDEVQDQPAYCRWLAPQLAALPALQAQLQDPARCADALAQAGQTPAPDALAPTAREALAALAVERTTSDREARIAANITRQLRHDARPLYGMWGLAHVVKAPVNNSTPMALHLVRQGINVRSLALLNLNGTMMIPTATADGGIGWTTMAYTMDSDAAVNVNGIAPFASAARGPITLFTLRGKGSPFRHGDSLTRASGRLAQMQPFAINPAEASDGLWADAIVISVGSEPTPPFTPPTP